MNNQQSFVLWTLILFAFRIIITAYCVTKAKNLNRSAIGWGFFGFFIPLVALIWIQFIKPVTIWEENTKEN